MQRTGPSAARSGLVLGAIGAVFALIFDGLLVIGEQVTDGSVTLGGCGVFLIILALCVEAGNMAATVSGRVSDGTIAGLIAGGMAGVGLGLSSPLLDVMNGSIAHSPLAAVIGSAVAIALSACTMGGLGAALGAFGGLIGQSRHAKANQMRSATDGTTGQR